MPPSITSRNGSTQTEYPNDSLQRGADFDVDSVRLAIETDKVCNNSSKSVLKKLRKMSLRLLATKTRPDSAARHATSWLRHVRRLAGEPAERREAGDRGRRVHKRSAMHHALRLTGHQRSRGLGTNHGHPVGLVSGGHSRHSVV